MAAGLVIAVTNALARRGPWAKDRDLDLVGLSAGPLLLFDRSVLEDTGDARSGRRGSKELVQLPAADQSVPNARVTRLEPEAALGLSEVSELSDRHDLLLQAELVLECLRIGFVA